MDEGDGLSGPGGAKNQRWRRMGTIQNRCKMGDDPADLLLANLPIEDFFENCRPLLLRKLFVIEVIRVNNKRLVSCC